ncbi:MAG: hypothetical protein ACYSU1_04800, partial [Planctomycetota bacterium]
MYWRSLPVLVVAMLASCGYQMVRPEVGDGRVVAVPTTVNRSDWHGIEVGLTREMRADLQRQLDIRLTTERSPDLTLVTEIEDIGRRSRVALRSGGAAIGISELALRWELLDAQGESLGSGVVRRNLEFLTALDEQAYDAFEEMYVEISQQIALEV